jgi:TonB family protein
MVEKSVILHKSKKHEEPKLVTFNKVNKAKGYSYVDYECDETAIYNLSVSETKLNEDYVVGLYFLESRISSECDDKTQVDEKVVSKIKSDSKDVAMKEEVDQENPVFVVVEEMPKFSYEGITEVREYFAKNVQYPKEAREKGIQGRVFVSFIVNRDGSVSDVKVERGVDPLLDNEVVRMVENMPKWTPGKQRGQAVRVAYTFPVIFNLDKK